MPACELTKKISNILVLYQILLIFAQKYIEMKIKEIQYISPDLFAPKDAWDKLSMAEKSEMMKVAVRNGITDLKTIREKYNEFAEGGDKETPRPVTTGGTGYIPDNYGQSTMDAVRRRLYRNITPFGYHNPISRTLGAIALNQQDDTRIEENKRIKDSVPEASALDALWATYLNIPENQRRAINSKYGISKTKDGYYRFNSPGMIFNFEQDLSPNGLFGLPGRKADMMNGILGNYTTGIRRDTKGDYIFYSDSRLNPDGTPNIKTGWDINPYSNTVDNDTEETTEEHGQYGQDKKDLSYKIGKALFGNIEDVSMGIGTPVPIYDKIYLDDYYGLSKEQQGGHYLPEITVYGSKHSLGGPLVEAAMNEYKSGGGIHIKPSHRGRLTELKKRTGKTEAELYRTGSPATRKMITFARNARKWKHGLGGNLFSGEEEGSQQMNIFRRPNGEYFYKASPDSEEISVTPLNTLFDNPALWTYTDANGKLYTPRQTVATNQGTIVKKEDEGPLVEAVKNYLGELQYDINNSVPIGGKYTMPAIAAGALLPLAEEAFAGTSIAGIPATTWADAALTAGFGAHGLNHAINEGIDGWGDAAMTALEVAQLGRLAIPIAQETINAGKNLAKTISEVRPEINNAIADRLGLPEMKGLVDNNGNYFESRFNIFGYPTFEERLISEGYNPVVRRGGSIVIGQDNIPVKLYSRTNPNNGVTETVRINPYSGGRLHQYNVTATNTAGNDLGSANIRRMSYGYKTPGSYKLGNQFDLALTAGDVPVVDKNIMKTFGSGLQKYTPKGTRITGDGSTSIADKVINSWYSGNYKDALKLAMNRPTAPTNNALSTDSYRYLVGYGNKYPGFSTFYDGYDTHFNNAGVKYAEDTDLLISTPKTLENIYLGLDPNYPGIYNGRLPHPWIKKK